MIELLNLTKRFGDLTAVNDVTLTVNRGEFFAVLGPNAAGKTTTIKMITGLIKPTSGSVRVAGHDVQAEPLECAAGWPMCRISPSSTTSSHRGNSSASAGSFSGCPMIALRPPHEC